MMMHGSKHNPTSLEAWTAFTAAAPAPLIEAWGDTVDPRGYIYDEPDFSSFSFTARHVPFTQISDRADGKFLPVYETETDLARIRGISRNLARFASVAIGAMESLRNYVIGTGFTFTAQPEEKKDPESRRIAEAAQRVVDELLDINDVVGSLDQELHDRSREDGETLVILEPDRAGRTHLRVIEPDQLVQPRNPHELHEWLLHEFDIDCEAFASSWTFGVHSPEGRPDRPLGYHVVYDGRGADWDYIPESRMLHLKRNVYRAAKRGVGDYYGTYEDLLREAKIRRNTADGAALQSAIAWIRENPPNATADGIMRRLAGNAEAITTRTTQAGVRSTRAIRYPSGSIIDMENGAKYHPGPMGSERNPNFVVIAQYVLRSIGVRWQMPEYIISGDASNANYASTMVAESPFVKAREADQEFYKKAFYQLCWKALRIAYEAGRFAGWTWEQVEAAIDVKIDAPAVATRDALKTAQTQQIELAIGTLSQKTAIAEAGRDPEEEIANGARPQAPPAAAGAPAQGSMPPASIGALAGAMESVESVDEARQMVRQLWESRRG